MKFMSHLKLLWDWDSFKGTIGALAAIIFPWLKVLTIPLQFLGAIGGLILLYYSIKHKRLQYKKEKEKR